jgi:outer membrane protein OmpA-like peptidoglycan-associated protein
MSDGKQGTIHSASDGGVSGEHPPAEPFQFFVGPSTSNEFNTARLRLVPIACLRVDDIRFKFDSSFIRFDPGADPNNPKDIRSEMRELALLHQSLPDSPLSIFGHADPVGNDDYNKALSGRRAKSIYAMLIRDTGLWEHLFNQSFGGDKWGNDSLETMRAATGLPRGTAHAALFKAYMDVICGADFRLGKKDFLAQGADSGGKGDFQGCGEFNPILIFSTEEQSAFDAAATNKDQPVLDDRNDKNAPNRRVMILIFRKGSKVLPDKWPCPRVTEGVAGCKKRFFSDGEQRRSNHVAGADRKFDDSQDTFACRFYQRISDNSPCERILPQYQIKLFDEDAIALPFAPFVALHGSVSDTGRAGSDAVLTLRDVKVPATVTIKWSRPKAGDNASSPPPAAGDTFDFELKVFVNPPADDTSDAVSMLRLNNLGYLFNAKNEDNIADFQNDYKSRLPADTLANSLGKLDAPTKDVLRDVYNSASPLPKSQDTAAPGGQ